MLCTPIIWQKKAEVNGLISVIRSYNFDEVLYGGKFDKVYLFQDDILTDSLSVKNIVRHNLSFTYDNIIQGLVPDTVLSISSNGSAIYFGGTFSYENPFVVSTPKARGVYPPASVSSAAMCFNFFSSASLK